MVIKFSRTLEKLKDPSSCLEEQNFDFLEDYQEKSSSNDILKCLHSIECKIEGAKDVSQQCQLA